MEATSGTIFDKDYLETLRQLNDEIFLLPGVDRPFMKSLWTANTRWVAVTEDGLDGDTVISDRYDGSPQAMAELRANVERSGEIGQLVAADFGSSIVYVPLLDTDPRTGAPLDYGELGRRIEELRTQVPERAHRHPRDRLRQGDRRPDGRRAPGARLLRAGAGDLRRRAVRLHPLRALAR